MREGGSRGCGGGGDSRSIFEVRDRAEKETRAHHNNRPENETEPSFKVKAGYICRRNSESRLQKARSRNAVTAMHDTPTTAPRPRFARSRFRCAIDSALT